MKTRAEIKVKLKSESGTHIDFDVNKGAALSDLVDQMIYFLKIEDMEKLKKLLEIRIEKARKKKRGY